MQRRSILQASLLALLAPAAAQASPAEPRRLRLRHAATGARFDGIYARGGVADPVGMQELSAVLADTGSGAIHLFDLDAVDIVWEMGRRQRMAEITVLSGYRTPASNRAVHGAGDSQHLRAAAMDLLVPAASYQAFGEAALKLGRGGVGLYPGRGFVHLDSGPVRHWGGEGPAIAMAPMRGLSRSELRQFREGNRGPGWPLEEVIELRGLRRTYRIQ